MPEARAIVPIHGVRAGLNATGSDIAKYRIVKKSTAAVDAIAPATDGSARCIGVTMEAVINGYTGDVQVAGRAKVEASAAIAIGAKITAAAGGKAVTAGAAANIIGVAASAAGANGEIIEVDIDREVTAA